MAHTTLFYGAGFTQKTTEAGKVAFYQLQKLGLRSRMVRMDLGSLEPVQSLIDSEIIDLFQISTAQNPLPMLRALSSGCWKPWWQMPTASGTRPSLTSPNHAVYWSQATGYVHQDMRAAVPAGCQLVGVNDLSKVGLYIFDGLQSAGASMLRASARDARMLGEQKSNAYREESVDPTRAEEVIAPSSLMSIGTVQNHIMDILAKVTELAVPRAILVTHESKGKDEFSGATEIGPAAGAGKALTTQFQKSVGDMIHFDRVSEKFTVTQPDGSSAVQEFSIVRAWMVPHRDAETGMLWPAGVRVSGLGNFGEPTLESQSQVQKLQGKWPGGNFNLSAGESVVELIRFKDTELVTSAEGLKRYREDVEARFAAGAGAGA